MRKEYKILLVIIGVGIILGTGGFFLRRILVKPYVILQQERTISILSGNQLPARDFVMSPAKIQINKMKLDQSITIPVKIINGEGDTTYNINFGDPVDFDKGFVTNIYNDYEYSWDKDTILVKANTTEVVNITIKKIVKSAHPNLEKGIAVTQEAGSGLSIVRSYIFEILIK
jgi:hypothetical protein